MRGSDLGEYASLSLVPFLPKAIVKTKTGVAAGGGIGSNQVGTVDSIEVSSHSGYLKAVWPEGNARELLVKIIVKRNKCT